MARLPRFSTNVSRFAKRVVNNSAIKIYRDVAALTFAGIIMSVIVFIPMLYLFNPYFEWFGQPNFSNKTFEVIKEVLLENKGNKGALVAISMPTEIPEIVNYNSTVTDVDYSHSPYARHASTDYFRLSVPGHSRRYFVATYTFHLENRIHINRNNIAENVKQLAIQSFDPTATTSNTEIDDTAKAITQGETDPYDRAETILKYVIDHMAYTYDYKYAHTGAVTAFFTGHGVCEEYAGLFTVMAQAVGLPCRYDYGVRISELSKGFQPIGAGHAWPEILLRDGHWIPIEATQNGLNTKRSIDWLQANLDRAFRNSFGIYMRLNTNCQVRCNDNSDITNSEILLTKEL